MRRGRRRWTPGPPRPRIWSGRKKGRATSLGRDIQIFELGVPAELALATDSHALGYSVYLDELTRQYEYLQGVVYPVHSQSTQKVQYHALLTTAKRRGLKLHVQKVAEHFWYLSLKEPPPTVAPDAQFLYFSLLPDLGGDGPEEPPEYSVYLDRLEEVGPHGFGVLYPLRQDVARLVQVSNLRKAASRRRLWVGFKLRGDKYELIYRGSWAPKIVEV